MGSVRPVSCHGGLVEGTYRPFATGLQPTFREFVIELDSESNWILRLRLNVVNGPSVAAIEGVARLTALYDISSRTFAFEGQIGPVNQVRCRKFFEVRMQLNSSVEGCSYQVEANLPLFDDIAGACLSGTLRKYADGMSYRRDATPVEPAR